MSTTRTFVRVLPLLAAVVLSAGSATYSTRRAALTPEIAPPMRSGEPMDSNVELAASAPGLARAGEPTATNGEEPGNVLPGYTVSTAFRMRVRDFWDLGLVYENASSNGARPLAADQPKVDGGDARGYGMSLALHKRAGENVNVAFIAEVMTYSIPFVEYRTCVANCEGAPSDEVSRGRTRVPVVTFGIVPNWKVAPWLSLFAGISARNQPTVDRGGIEYGENDSHGDVRPGDLNVMISGGAELTLGRDFKVMAMVYKNVDGKPLDYPATLAVGVRLGIGRVEKPVWPPPAPPAPAPTVLTPPATERTAPPPEPEAPTPDGSQE